MGLRIGKVQAVDEETSRVRVYFEDDRIMSGWLTVIKSFMRASVLASSEEQGHEHTVNVPQSIPVIGEPVLCIYADGFNADGFVIGSLRGEI